MKNKLKISAICALCAVMASPAMAAPSVRTLGGAGTYAGTQSATNARGAMTVGNSSINSVRMNNRAASARTASTQRLAIGRYLGKNASISGGALGSVKPGQSSDNSELTERIDVLADDVTGVKDNISELTADVVELADRLSELSGESVNVEYENGVLIITQNGVAESIDLTELSDADAVAELQTAVADLRDAIDALQVGQAADLQNYYTKTASDERFATKSEISDMETKANASATYALKSELPTDYVTQSELGNKLSAPTANGNWMLSVSDGGTQWVSIQVADTYPVQ